MSVVCWVSIPPYLVLIQQIVRRRAVEGAQQGPERTLLFGIQLVRLLPRLPIFTILATLIPLATLDTLATHD